MKFFLLSLIPGRSETHVSKGYNLCQGVKRRNLKNFFIEDSILWKNVRISNDEPEAFLGAFAPGEDSWLVMFTFIPGLVFTVVCPFFDLTLISPDSLLSTIVLSPLVVVLMKVYDEPSFELVLDVFETTLTLVVTFAVARYMAG